MRRAVLPVLLALATLASPVGAQTAANSAGASSLSPRPAPRVEPSRSANPAYAVLFANLDREDAAAGVAKLKE